MDGWSVACITRHSSNNNLKMDFKESDNPLLNITYHKISNACEQGEKFVKVSIMGGLSTDWFSENIVAEVIKTLVGDGYKVCRFHKEDGNFCNSIGIFWDLDE